MILSSSINFKRNVSVIINPDNVGKHRNLLGYRGKVVDFIYRSYYENGQETRMTTVVKVRFTDKKWSELHGKEVDIKPQYIDYRNLLVVDNL